MGRNIFGMSNNNISTAQELFNSELKFLKEKQLVLSDCISKLEKIKCPSYREKNPITYEIDYILTKLISVNTFLVNTPEYLTTYFNNKIK